jgi:transcriptional regulator of acetoin/glycerol metabolism
VRALHHDRSPPDAPLATLDCPLLAAGDAAEAEALDALRQTGAGILVLREVGALPMPLQARLLREATASGAARIVATTTRPLAELVAAGHFPDADFAALGGRHLTLPPLRERTDFDALVRQFVREACPERTVYVCPDALRRLRAHRWPGNLRELRNQLQLILALMGDDAGQLCLDDIPPELFDEDSAGDD